eukprot:3890964-Alexandrium_andersonii.AAC.1
MPRILVLLAPLLGALAADLSLSQDARELQLAADAIAPRAPGVEFCSRPVGLAANQNAALGPGGRSANGHA